MYFSGFGAASPCEDLARQRSAFAQQNAALYDLLVRLKACQGLPAPKAPSAPPPMPTTASACSAELSQMSMILSALPEAMTKVQKDLKAAKCPTPAAPAGPITPAAPAVAEEEGTLHKVMDVWSYLKWPSMLACAYHGYKRNHSVGWSIAWGLFGVGPIAPVIAVAQGFGKPKAGLTPNRSRHRRRR